MAPYFSIILPIYNVAKYLPRCVQSILNQDFTNYEIILVDDGSPDESPALCDEYAREHDHIRVIHKANGGLSSARNVGLEIARGKYVWWVDSDDWIEPGSLRRLHDASVSQTPDVIKFSHIRQTDVRTVNQTCVPAGYYQRASLPDVIDQAFLRSGKYSLSAWSHVYRTDLLRENGLHFVSEREIGSEDYLFNLQVLLHVRSMCVIDDALYNYELRIGSLSQVYKKDLFDRYIRLYDQLKDCCRAAGREKDFAARIDRFFVWHLVRGTCFADEYTSAKGHTIAEGRKNVVKYLRHAKIRSALRHCDTRDLRLKDHILLSAMRMGIEPLFYYLYVIKPKKGARNEA